MSARAADFSEALERATVHATRWLESMPTRRVAPTRSASDIAQLLDGPLPDGPMASADVIDRLAELAEPGLMGTPSGRFFGWVIGGTLPAALAADWLVSAWDQNAGLRYSSPAAAALEETAGAWLLDVLDLPRGSDVGFTTGATMANFVGLAAGRQFVLDRLGWDVSERGLTGAPPVTVLVGAERHSTVDAALRYLGLGTPTSVASDDQGCILPDALRAALARVDGPVVVALQAGNIHSGASDPFEETIALAHDHDAWVHVDGAFGLWAAASPKLRHLVSGLEAADSWATDAHKTLNVPYDCGVAIVSRPEVIRATFGVHASYLVADQLGPGDQLEKVPELSRRARGVPVWAALQSLGRSGTVALVERLVDTARALADGVERIPTVEVLNDVVFTQVCMSFGSDERTRRATDRLIAEGDVWMSGSRWRDRDVLRISVSNWSTDAADVATAIAAVERAATAAAE
ncbi:MAG TPA: aminotransferase class V-fold PLP-dependent enzyme [Leifsonia sp.]|jgi:glutamate/tyrosine decarboxylase-like PLP-dependent enzyme|nr:aminotransferase class V-fold PLP-dependent enzyme [Leifsonia sp.]